MAQFPSAFVGSQPVALGLCATPSSNATIAARVQARPASCKYRRIDCNWATNQSGTMPPGTQPGGFDTLTATQLDVTVDAAFFAGKKLVMCFGYTPTAFGGTFGTGGNQGHIFPNRDAANGFRDAANALYNLARRCEQRRPGVVIAWEFWNEPQNGFLNWTDGKPNVTYYGNMCETAYVLFRTGVLLGRANRTPLPTSVELWTGGTGATPSVGSPFRHLNWTRTLLQRATRLCDAVSIHMYSGGCPLGTANGYDPAVNDIPGIYAALQASPWAHQLQIHDTESWTLHRPDDTIDDPNSNNCASYGKPTGGNANLTIEMRVSVAAGRMQQHWDWWSQHAAQFQLGLSFQPQQDTTAPNNTDETAGGGPNAAFNHGGLYQYDSGRNGAATVDLFGNPALVNVFNDIQQGAASSTDISFGKLAAFGAGLPRTTDIDLAISDGLDGFRCGFIDWDTADPTFSGTYTEVKKFTDIIRYANQKSFRLIIQPSLGATFGGKASNGDFGQLFNHTARDHDASGNPIGPVVDVPVKISAWIVSLMNFYNGQGGRPIIVECELLNEVNHFRADDGAHSRVGPTLANPDINGYKAKSYLEILARVYPALKAARPELVIYTSGLGGDKASDSDVEALQFTKDLFDATTTITVNSVSYSTATHKLFDYYNWHPYYHDVDSEPPRILPITWPNGGWAHMILAHDFIAAQPGYCDVKFVTTESGYPISLGSDGLPNGEHTLAESASAMRDMMAAWQSYPWAGGGGMGFCWFNYYDRGASVDKGKAFGLRDATGRPNGARYSTYASYRRVANPPPVTTCYTPKKDVPAGGVTLTIEGSFLTGASVKIGGVACTSVVATATHLTCVTPAHVIGVVPLVVTTAHGAVTAGDFQYVTPGGGVPTVTGLSPSTDDHAGGVTVTITGTNFPTVDPIPLTAVKFGAVNATSITAGTATHLTAVVPAALPSQVHVTVTNATGTSTATAADLFTYTSTPPSCTVLAISLADGTVFENFTNPITVRGTIAFAWLAEDSLGIQSTKMETDDGIFLGNGTPGNGLYGCEFDTTQLPNGPRLVQSSALNPYNPSPGVSATVAINIDNQANPESGLFAVPFYTIYTIPDDVPLPPSVVISSATPNPLTPSDDTETVVWSSNQAGNYVVSVGNATVGSGTNGAGEVVTLIPRTAFVDGLNIIRVTVTNANGSGLASITITRGTIIIPESGLCWAAPLSPGPREDMLAEAIVNRLGRHIVAPQVAGNVFILKSGAVVTDWITPDDPPRVCLFGGTSVKLSQPDADLLSAAGYAANLVACPSSPGWDTGGWDTGPWDA